MIRFLIFLLLGLVLMLLGHWALQNPSELHIALDNQKFSISTAMAVTYATMFCIVLAICSALLWQALNWPERRRARRRYRTLSKGLDHLTQGFTALALGDETAAAIALKKASAALPDQPLPQLLTSQLLQRQGNTEESRGVLRVLLKHDVTAMLATHTLIEQHMTRREWAEAATLAETALQESPRDRWLVLKLIDLHAHRGNYLAMLELADGWQFRSPLSREERHRITALAHYLIARREKEAHLQRRHLEQAVNYAPEFLPAALDLAVLLTRDGDIKKARKMLLAAWLKQPSPILITPILDTLRMEEERQQTRLLKPFLKEPKTAIHQLLIAQQALNIKAFEAARPAITAALALEESKLACQMMAQVERELTGSAAANSWLARAMDAPTGERWVCRPCGHTHEIWYSHCEICAAFDSLAYERPEARIVTVETATS